MQSDETKTLNPSPTNRPPPPPPPTQPTPMADIIKHRSKPLQTTAISLSTLLENIHRGGFCEHMQCWVRMDPDLTPSDSLGSVFKYIRNAASLLLHNTKTDTKTVPLSVLIEILGENETLDLFLQGIGGQIDFKYVYQLYDIQDYLVKKFKEAGMDAMTEKIKSVWTQDNNFFYSIELSHLQNIEQHEMTDEQGYLHDMKRVERFLCWLAHEFEKIREEQKGVRVWSPPQTYDTPGDVFTALKERYREGWMPNSMFVDSTSKGFDKQLNESLKRFFETALDQRPYHVKYAGTDCIHDIYKTILQNAFNERNVTPARKENIGTAMRMLGTVSDNSRVKGIEYQSFSRDPLPEALYINTRHYGYDSQKCVDFLLETLKKCLMCDKAAHGFFGVTPGHWYSLHWGKSIYDVWKTPTYWDHVALYTVRDPAFWEYFFVDIVTAHGETTSLSKHTKLTTIKVGFEKIFNGIRSYIERGGELFADILPTQPNSSFLPPPGSSDNKNLLGFVTKICGNVFPKTATRVAHLIEKTTSAGA